MIETVLKPKRVMTEEHKEKLREAREKGLKIMNDNKKKLKEERLLREQQVKEERLLREQQAKNKLVEEKNIIPTPEEVKKVEEVKPEEVKKSKKSKQKIIIVNDSETDDSDDGNVIYIKNKRKHKPVQVEEVKPVQIEKIEKIEKVEPKIFPGPPPLIRQKFVNPYYSYRPDNY
jgi:hypothetical protein